jgi:hypothetical protein
MKHLNCDVCDKDITTAISNRTYFHIANRDICEECKDKLEAEMKPVVRTKQPFSYEWYDRLERDSLEKAIARGKF